jgi:hypothetical protein
MKRVGSQISSDTIPAKSATHGSDKFVIAILALCLVALGA